MPEEILRARRHDLRAVARSALQVAHGSLHDGIEQERVAAFEIHRTLGVTNETAWFMLHRVREAMKRGELTEQMAGTIVADETWVGGGPPQPARQQAGEQ